MKRTISAALLLTVLLTGCSLPALRTEQAVGPREQNDLYAAQTQRQADTYQPVLVRHPAAGAFGEEEKKKE